MTNRVLINDKIPQINAITTKGNVGIEIKLDIFTPKIFSLDNLYFFKLINLVYIIYIK